MIDNEMRKQGDLTPTGNHRFMMKITNIHELIDEFNSANHVSMWWRHRMYPTAVLENQSLMVLRNSIKWGNIWIMEKVK
jgi:hypothetical protein